MIVAGIVNIIFDPLLIFGIGPFPRLGLEGAAIATVISRIVTLVAAIYILHFKLGFLVNPFSSIKYSLLNIKRLTHIALPATFSNAITPISMFIVTSLLSGYGEEVIAGFGAGTRIEMFFTMIRMGISSGLGPLVGQNYGARNYVRVQDAIKSSNFLAFIWVAFVTIVTFLFSDSLSRLFSTNEVVIGVSSFYLRVIVISILFSGIFLNINSALNVIGKSKFAMLLTVFKMIILYIPLALTLKRFFNHSGIFYAAFVANSISGIVAYLSMKKIAKEWPKEEGA